MEHIYVRKRKATHAHTPTHTFTHTSKIRTGDRAQQSQGGRIARVLIDHALAVRFRCRHAQRDGLVELAASRLHGDDGRHGDAAAEQLGRQIRIDRLGLRLHVYKWMNKRYHHFCSTVPRLCSVGGWWQIFTGSV